LVKPPEETSAPPSASSFTCEADGDALLRVYCRVEVDPQVPVVVVAEEIGGHGAVVRSPPSLEGYPDVWLWGLAEGAEWSLSVEGYDLPPIPWSTPVVVGPDGPPPFDRLTVRAATRPGEAVEGAPVWLDVACADALEDGVWARFDRHGRLTAWFDPGGQTVGFARSPTGNVLGIVDNARVVDWDPTNTRSETWLDVGCAEGGGGPCPHHAIGSDGTQVWHATAALDAGTYAPWGLPECPEKDVFVLDGVYWRDVDRTSWLADLGITPDTTGPNEDLTCDSAYWLGTLEPTPIDPTHLNGADLSADPWLLSLAAIDRLVQVDPATWTVVQSLSSARPEGSDVTFAVDPSIVEHDAPGFAGQHDPHQLDGAVQIYDNLGDPTASRVVRMRLEPGLATTEAVYTLVDDDDGTWASPEPLVCPTKGAGIPLANGNVLASCTAAAAVMELDQPDGTTRQGPRWFLQLGCGDEEAKGFFRPFPDEP
jgi:YD repeat-containing protein